MTRAMRTEAARYPGQEQQVMEFFRKNPQAAEGLRGPIFEEKVVDFILELAKVDRPTVTPEELSQPPERPGRARRRAARRPGARPDPATRPGCAGPPLPCLPGTARPRRAIA